MIDKRNKNMAIMTLSGCSSYRLATMMNGTPYSFLSLSFDYSQLSRPRQLSSRQRIAAAEPLDAIFVTSVDKEVGV